MLSVDFIILYDVFSSYVKEKFAGPVDPRGYWSYGACTILNKH